MTITRCAAGAILLVLMSAGAAAAGPQSSLRDRQAQACSGDALKLCGDVIPDVGKITMCLKAKRAQLSPKCAAMFVTHPRRPGAASPPRRR